MKVSFRSDSDLLFHRRRKQGGKGVVAPLDFCNLESRSEVK